jgi:quercetin dioxygenase-like cupin family protein
MTSMDKTLPPHSQLFTVRLWREDLGDGQGEWRGKVRHVMKDELCYFRDWSTLIDFLIAKLPDPEPPDRASLAAAALTNDRRKLNMSDLEHIQGKYTTLDLVKADIAQDGFRMNTYQEPIARTVPEHSHAIDETVYVLRGSMTFTVDGRSYKLDVGDKLRLQAGTLHSVSVEAETEYAAGWNNMP